MRHYLIEYPKTVLFPEWQFSYITRLYMGNLFKDIHKTTPQDAPSDNRHNVMPVFSSEESTDANSQGNVPTN
jgi:hypothetical protein